LRIIEVVDGVTICAKEPPHELALVAGRRGRLEPGGRVYEVDRVTDCASYLHKVYDPPLVREIGADELALAVTALLSVVATGHDGYKEAVKAHRAAAKYRTISITRGPGEPGISRNCCFAERVS
jgi:hypothetical protein